MLDKWGLRGTSQTEQLEKEINERKTLCFCRRQPGFKPSYAGVDIGKRNNGLTLVSRTSATQCEDEKNVQRGPKQWFVLTDCARVGSHSLICD